MAFRRRRDFARQCAALGWATGSLRWSVGGKVAIASRFDIATLISLITAVPSITSASCRAPPASRPNTT
ncbi:hypothetical protein I552_3599 [Mycobacterium xenopi 3993]|nr:hypothetical protein I552_3599 [Mycobacterium xenopi 3993]